MTKIFPNSMEKIRDDAKGDGVDIIVRTKDRPMLLARALASIINQEHSNWHIYLINDGGSPVPVGQVLEIFKDQLAAKITVIHNEKSVGMSAAANMGLVHGVSEFVAIHDDDDSWDRNFLKTTTSFLLAPENRRFGGLLTKWNFIQESFDGDEVTLLSTEEKGYPGEVVDFLDVLRTPDIPPIALTWRRDVCKHVGFFNENLAVLDDWDLNLRILQVADIAVLQEALANYHVRPQAAGTYSNSVTLGRPTHKRYYAMYRNSMMRAHLNQNPEQIGLVMGLLRNSDIIHKNINNFATASHTELAKAQVLLHNRLSGVEAELKDVKALLNKIHDLVLKESAE
jgi:glycosyltransferase involved in cell wall biosynthesis